MKQDSGKNYYQLLDISPEATNQEIEAGYKKSKVVYDSDSVATYSLFSSKEKENILNKIVEAYETLKDPEKRKAYDSNLTKPSQEDYHDLLDVRDGDDDALTINKNQIDQGAIEVPRRIEKPDSSVKLKKSLVVMHNDIAPLVSEQYRILFTRIQQINLWRSYKIFSITSAMQGEGKTVTSLNLAYLMAKEFNKKVILVECDFRKPSIASYFLDERKRNSVIDVINGEIDLWKAIIRLENSDLYFLTARNDVKHSPQMLDSVEMKEILSTLKTEFDYVIVDSPPIIPLADMTIISRMVDGLIIVVRAGKVSKNILLKAINSLPTGDVIGIVLNGADNLMKNSYYNYSSK